MSLFSSWENGQSYNNVREPPEDGIGAPDKDHHWFHSMILYRVLPESVTEPSVEERLASLESNFQNLQTALLERETQLTERLERLENILGQIVSVIMEKRVP